MDTFWIRRRKKERNKIEEKKKHDERFIKDRTIRDNRKLFEQQEEDYHIPKRVNNFWNQKYIKYESNGDKNRSLSLDEYLNKIEC